MGRAAHAFGLTTVVGNVIDTSPAMAQAILLGQLLNVVDLHGPVLHKTHRGMTVDYFDDKVTCPELRWGSAA